MRDTVDIKSYWIKDLRKIKEFQEIAKVEDIEFLRLFEAVTTILNNLFIETADEDGISRFESIIGIKPDDTDTLEQRRARVYSYWSDRNPYTLEELEARLETLCGSGNYEVTMDYANYTITVITNVGGYGIIDEVLHLLDYILPANLLLVYENALTQNPTTSIYYGCSGATTAMSYTVTNDVNATYPLDVGIGAGAAAVTAESLLVTNDVDETYSMALDVNSASATTVATETTVTNDINTSAELSEEKTVASVVTTSQVITVNEEE